MKIISLKIKMIIMFLSAAIFGSLGCGDQALFDDLATNQVKVIIKGTYESNGPRDWQLPLSSSILEDVESVYLHEDPGYSEDVPPSLFMLDIAGIKVVDSSNHSQYFANYRKTYSAALDNVASLFNGDGVVYKNDDMRPNFTWSTVQLLIRKMLFDNAKQYVPATIDTWAADSPEYVQDMFAEKTVNGFNFNLAQVLSYYDSLKMNYADINRIFPLNIPVEDGFIFDNKEPETVLEIRLVIKNFVKKYEYEYNDTNSNRKLRHFYAVSDWLRNVLKDEAAPTSDSMGKMGGNVLAVARYYVPGKTATITVESTSSVISSGNRYVVAINSKHNISEYQMIDSNRVRPPNTGGTICDAPKTPRLPITNTNTNAYIEALLQYYLQYEVYKSNYDTFINCTNDSSTNGYEYRWNLYNSTLNSFKIPSLVTWSDGTGAYSFENVPVGETYTIYESNSDPGPGNLPSGVANAFDTTPLTSVTLTEGDAGQTINIP